MDEVAFEVSQPIARLGGCRSVLDADAVGDDRAGRISACPEALLAFAESGQEAMELAAALPVFVEQAVNELVADRFGRVEFGAAGDLLGSPVLPQPGNDPGARFEALAASELLSELEAAVAGSLGFLSAPEAFFLENRSLRPQAGEFGFELQRSQEISHAQSEELLFACDDPSVSPEAARDRAFVEARQAGDAAYARSA